MLLNAHDPQAIDHAAQVLARGELLGLPTETVYGLAADAGNEAAVRQIFTAKGRPTEHPLIVHVASADDVREFASDVPGFAQALIEAFWPGPLTLILPRRADRAAVAAGGQDSVGVRCPSHPTAQAVLRAARDLGVRGVAAPSANRFGRVSPTTAAHVQQEFADLCVIDGGACDVGIESTIVDCTRGAPVLLRPGQITPEQLSHACGVAVIDPHAPANGAAATKKSTTSKNPLQAPAPRASGTLASHYAPLAKVRLMRADACAAALDAHLQHNAARVIALWTRQAPTLSSDAVRWRRMPSDAQQCAHDLFAVLREFDAQGVAEIWVEQPPEGASWDGVRDRLTRAAA